MTDHPTPVVFRRCSYLSAECKTLRAEGYQLMKVFVGGVALLMRREPEPDETMR